MAVGAGDHQLGAIGDDDVDAGRNGVADRVGVTESEVEDVALEGSLETDALDQEGLGVTGGHALAHVADDGADGSMESASGAGLLDLAGSVLDLGEVSDVDDLGVDDDADLLREGFREFALRSLDDDDIVLHGHGHLIRNVDGLLTNSAH